MRHHVHGFSPISIPGGYGQHLTMPVLSNAASDKLVASGFPEDEVWGDLYLDALEALAPGDPDRVERLLDAVIIDSAGRVILGPQARALVAATRGDPAMIGSLASALDAIIQEAPDVISDSLHTFQRFRRSYDPDLDDDDADEVGAFKAGLRIASPEVSQNPYLLIDTDGKVVEL